jgi:glyoxylase I family protein
MEEETSPEREPGIALIGLSTFPPDGDEVTHFIGSAVLRRIPGFELEARLAYVQFKDGAKTLWHYHRGLQVLWFVDGEGEVEQQGDEANLIRCGAGQMVRVLPYVRHRHGARVGQTASHLAITSGSTCWEDDPCWTSERGLLEKFARVASMDFPRLSVGDSGSHVAHLHEKLRASGLTVPGDEIRRTFFGPATRDAVLKYQAEHGLTPTGIIDQPTAGCLGTENLGGRGSPVTAERSAGEPKTGAAAHPRPPVTAAPGATGKQTSLMPAKNHATPFASMRGDHVAVRVPDYEAGKHWYMEKLDFRVVREWPSGELRLGYLATATDHGFFLELMGGGSPTPRRDYADLDDSLCDAGYHHLCLHVDSIDETVAELRRRGVTIVHEPFTIEPISRRLAFLADQWGNLIELSETV